MIDDIDRLFEQLVRTPWSRPRVPSAEAPHIAETAIDLEMPLSGGQLDDVSVSLRGRQLIVRTQRRSLDTGVAAETSRLAEPDEQIVILPEAAEVSAIEAQIRGEMLHVRVHRRGTPKFVERVREVTFNAAQAVRAGKTVRYVTPVGTFLLTPRGLELIEVMPGMDVRKDILEATPMRIRLPASGEPQLLPDSLLTGDGFVLPACAAAARPVHTMGSGRAEMRRRGRPPAPRGRNRRLRGRVTKR